MNFRSQSLSVKPNSNRQTKLETFWCSRNEGTPRLCLRGVTGTLLSSRAWEDTEPRKSCQVHCGPTTKIMFSVNKVWRHTTKASADRGGNKPGRSLGNTPSSSAEQECDARGLWGKARVGCVKTRSFPPPTPRAALSGEYQRLFSLTLHSQCGWGYF